MRLCGALLNSGEIDDGANDSAAAHNFVTGVGFHVEGEEAAVDFGQASRGLDHRSLRGGLQVANHLRRPCPVTQQLHKLSIQSINLISQLFQRHSVLMLNP